MEADGRVIRHVGRGTFLASASATTRSVRPDTSPADIITARVLGAVFKHLGQPILHLLTRERLLGMGQGAEGEQTAS